MLRRLLPELIRAYDIRADYWFLYSVMTDGVQQRGDYKFSIASDDICVNDSTTRITLNGSTNLFSMCGTFGVLSIFNFEPTVPLTPIMIYFAPRMNTIGYTDDSNVDLATIILAIYDDFMAPLLTSLKVCMTIVR